jgi:hypothetical protein
MVRIRRDVMLSRVRGSDRGATAIFVAMTLVLLIGVAAVAIDLAQGWNERRQDQTSADLAAVAGALSYGVSNTSVADEAMAAARQNLDTTYSDAEWNALWTNCTGTPPSAAFIPAQSSIGQLQCIALHPDFVWVRLPDQLVDTSFGGVVGVDTITTAAEATVTLIGEDGGGALPFAIRGNSGSGEVCLDTGPNPDEPCDGNEAGSFGNIAPPLFGNEALNTYPSCDHQSSSNNYVAESIAMGIDHILWEFSVTAWTNSGWTPDQNTANNTVRSNPDTHLDECVDVGERFAQAKDGVPINTVYVDTGNSTKDDVTAGMMTGTGFPDGGNARLTRSSNTRNVKGYHLDNTPLWDFLGDMNNPPNPDPEDGHGIAACDGPTIRGLPTIEDKNAAMRTCLETYPSNGPQIFSDDIIETPRIGVAPRLWHNNLGTGITFRPIKSFDVVYIHGIWLKDGGNLLPFWPGDGNSPITGGSLPIEQVTAYLLTDSMVSAFVHTSLGGFSNDTWQPEIYE